MKTLILTDIHGCFDAMRACLEKAGFCQETDTLIVLGDFIDRGQQVFQTMNVLRSFKETMEQRCIILMGNHEHFPVLLDTNPDLTTETLWVRHNGGKETIEDLAFHDSSVSEYITWLKELPLYYENDAYICTHAGIGINGPLHTDPDTFLWDRSIANKGWYHGKLLFYGHTPMKQVCFQDGFGYTQALRPGIRYKLPQYGSIGLDTGCVFGYKLSILALYEDRTFQIFQEETMTLPNIS